MGLTLFAFAGLLALASGQPVVDVGTYKEQLLKDRSMELFGIGAPTGSQGTSSPRFKGQTASSRQTLAKGLKASFVSRSVASNGDQIAFWPDDINYTHLIVCIENQRAGKSPKGNTGVNPGVQRIEVKTGKVETILYGTVRCDPVRTTQWGTVIVGEESGADGGLYEILNPLTTTGHWIASRGGAGAPADVRDAIDSTATSTAVIKRTALPGSSWESMHTLSNGVFYGADELRPNLGLKGGAVYKFVPTKFYDCGVANLRPGLLCPNKITDLSQSPLVSGSTYAIQAICSGGSDFGSGCLTGAARWIKITSTTNPRAQVNAVGATGYCRPEDMDMDRDFGVFGNGMGAKADMDTFKRVLGATAGLRWCWTNTCDGGNFRGAVNCGIEGAADIDAAKEVVINGQTYLSTDGTKPAQFFVKRLLQGDPRFDAQDNISFQAKSNNMIFTEDPEDGFGELWMCLPDGQDRDLGTDGCISVLGINDPLAEPTGIIFDGTGTVAFYHIQHGSQSPDLLDFVSNPVDGTTDDLIMLTGFKIPTGFSGPGVDVGTHIETNLFNSRTRDLFGFDAPIGTAVTEVARQAGQSASDRQTLAAGLSAEFVTRSVASNGDQIAFWPDDINYTHLFVCIEVSRGGTTPKGNSGYNPGVQRIEIATGKVETVLHGTSSCDGIRTTQWGTILATEENGADGGAYEIFNPLTTTGHWIANRGGQGGQADVRDGVDSPNTSQNIVKRYNMPAISYEGLQILHNGVVIAGDELRPGGGLNGGGIYKFVPSILWNCGAVVRPGLICPNKIKELSQSPLVDGRIYGLQTICDTNADYGQGCDSGIARWVRISSATNPRPLANSLHINGFCRPEDLDLDTYFGIYGKGINSGADEAAFLADFNKAAGIRYCWTNTCGDALFGEVLCAVEAADDLDAQSEVTVSGVTFLSSSGKNTYNTFQLRRFQDGDPFFHDVDNIEFQPLSNNVFVIEDYPNGFIYSCLPDGPDRDIQSDGCLPLLSINSRDAEPTGFVFDGTGTTAYYIIQHGTQTAALRNFVTSPLDGSTDDLIKITGFTIPVGYCGWFALVSSTASYFRNIGPLLNGSVIDLSTTDGFNIKYTPCTRGKIASVSFILNGAQVVSDTTTPYTIAGEIKGRRYNSFTPPVGNHTLTVQVFQPGQSPSAETKTVSFTVV